jgi:hypothetical protein
MSIDLSDLGLLPVTSAATEQEGDTLPNAPLSSSHPIQTASLLARTLFHVWRGDRVSLIESPPGAGKTTLICEALYHLLRDSELTIVVACPTRDGAFDLASRLVKTLGTDKDAPKVIWSVKGMTMPEGSHEFTPMGTRSVIVRTTASCKFKPPAVDLLIFDEAYQTTYSDAAKAASSAQQILMVGDPGQIGPVVRVNTRFWDHLRFNPANRAPEAFAKMKNAVILHMDATFRVGQETVEVIAPLYGFDFVSKRPERHMLDSAGNRLGEIESLRIKPIPTRSHFGTMSAVTDYALSFVGTTARSFDEDGNPVDEVIEAKDVAIVVPHNDQSSALSALLRNSSAPNLPYPGAGEAVYVGTADRAQGGQWKVVVALDPMLGHARAGSHQLALGRLCVMLSRHTHHLTWIHDGEWEEKFKAILEADADASEQSVDDAHRSIAVRRLCTRVASRNSLDTSAADDRVLVSA